MRWNKPYRSAHSRHRTEQSTACCQRNHSRQTLVGRNDQASALRFFSLIEKSLTGSGTVSHHEVTIRLLLHVTLVARRNARISHIPRSQGTMRGAHLTLTVLLYGKNSVTNWAAIASWSRESTKPLACGPSFVVDVARLSKRLIAYPSEEDWRLFASQSLDLDLLPLTTTTSHRHS
jgi:hypothetical protein